MCSLIQKFFQLVDDIVRLAHAGFDKFFGIFSDLFVKSFVVIAQFFKFVLHVFEFFFRFYFVDFCQFGQLFGGFRAFSADINTLSNDFDSSLSMESASSTISFLSPSRLAICIAFDVPVEPMISR